MKHPGLWTALGLATWVAAVTACSQAPAPETPGPEAPDVETIAPDAAEAAPQADAEADKERKDDPSAEGSETSPGRSDDKTVIPIVPARESQPHTLWEAAVSARKQREENPRPRISVTDENLHEFQDAKLTIAAPREEKAPADAASEEGEGKPEDAHGEEYWRSTVLDLRLRLRTAVDELSELEGQAAGLRRSFYAEDDPYVRDAEIKPAWDRALDRIGETRRDILTLYRQLEDTLEEGRQAGALPGWLREGIELEPEPDELPQPRETTHEPGEPEIMEIEPPPDGGEPRP